MAVFGDAGFSQEELARYLQPRGLSDDAKERHETDPFGMDTFDGTFFSCHLQGLSWRMGPSVAIREYNYAAYSPHNRHLYEEEGFVAHLDRVARKTMLFYNIAEEEKKTFLLKGHFLASAPALRRNYPDARFLTVLRDPCDRLRSAINYLAVNPALGERLPAKLKWQWLTATLQETEAMYCENELKWFQQDDVEEEQQPNETRKKRSTYAVRFHSFATNTDKVLKRVYQDFLQKKVPDGISYPTSSSSRKQNKKRYSINKSLAELGVDEADYKKRLTDYIAWMGTKQKS